MRGATVLAGLVLVGSLVPAGADTFTVGAGGSHATIQSAVDAALARRGSHEVHVAIGHWAERVVVGDSMEEGDSLVISGGWGPSFGDRVAEPSLTVIHGGGQAPVFRAGLGSGKLTVTGFTVTAGSRPDEDARGGGVRISAWGRAEIRLEGNWIADNPLVTAPDRGQADGGGLWASVGGDASLIVQENRFAGNSVDARAAGEGSATGGGVRIEVSTRGHAQVVGNELTGNTARGKWAVGSALSALVFDSGQLEVSDNTITDNVTDGEIVEQAALHVQASSSTPTVMRRNTLTGNRGGQVSLSAHPFGGGSELLFTDSLVAAGEDWGVSAAASAGGRLALTNLTITRHPDLGLSTYADGGKIFLSNSIVFDNSPDLRPGGALEQSRNLIAVDPLFVLPSHGNYRVQPASPAVDGGDDHPPLDLGPTDLARDQRVRGDHVDIGAYESHRDCEVLWPGVSRYTAACICLSDPGLRGVHCGFFLPDLFLVFETAWEWESGRPAAWTIHPWTDVAAPYAMEMAGLRNGQWLPQPWLGPTAPGLKTGELVVEPFQLKLPGEGPALLHTTLEYQRPGDKEPRRVELQVILPDRGPAPPK